jgi:hypothetical protein
MAVSAATLTDLGARLRHHLDDPARFSAVTTRVLLRTGVSLREPRGDQEQDQVLVARVRDVLAEMGFRF